MGVCYEKKGSFEGVNLQHKGKVFRASRNATNGKLEIYVQGMTIPNYAIVSGEVKMSWNPAEILSPFYANDLKSLTKAIAFCQKHIVPQLMSMKYDSKS